MEFKNANNDKMLKFIKMGDKDDIWSKIADSAALLKDMVEFNGYDGDQIISNTHLILVYGEKANTVSTMHMNLGKKDTVIRDRNGRQSRLVSMGWQKNKEYSLK